MGPRLAAIWPFVSSGRIVLVQTKHLEKQIHRKIHQFHQGTLAFGKFGFRLGILNLRRIAPSDWISEICETVCDVLDSEVRQSQLLQENKLTIMDSYFCTID